MFAPLLQVDIVWQIYLICYYATKRYTADIKEDHIESMALCGNPFAICRMLINNDISDDKREVYERKLNTWKQTGQYITICPTCFAPRGVEDVFCPDCGTKIK